jgi:hypothetical protein
MIPEEFKEWFEKTLKESIEENWEILEALA